MAVKAAATAFQRSSGLREAKLTIVLKVLIQK